jgi:hypothetical protein
MKPNLIIAAIALLIPIVAEFFSPETGLGFDVLLYWPFDFAYVLLVGVFFVAANVLAPKVSTTLGSVFLGVSFWLGWFLVSFLAVSQLHLSLGYKL